MSDDPYWNTDPDDDQSGRFAGGDALVTGSFGPWWSAAVGVVSRSWRSMGLILLIGVVLPRWVFGAYGSLAASEADMDSLRPGHLDDFWPGLPAAITGGLLGLALLYLAASSALAATRSAAAEAAGGFLSLGEAFSFGFGRGWKLWLWLLPAWLTVSVGLVLCVLPGVWAAFALSLMVPAATFEHRRSPYARSIGLTHSAFWPALGRLVIVMLVVFAANLVIGIVGALLSVLWNTVFSGWLASVLVILSEALLALLLLAPVIWVLAAVLCTYAWLRGRVESVSATSLSAEAAGEGPA